MYNGKMKRKNRQRCSLLTFCVVQVHLDTLANVPGVKVRGAGLLCS